MSNEKGLDIEEPYRFVKDFCTPSTPHTVNIVTTVKKHKHKFCCYEGFLILRIILMALFLLSASGFGLMWFTEIYNDTLISNLVLSENSSAVDWWSNPPLKSNLKVHIFNYTNFEEWKEGKAEKLILDDIGPFIYTEQVSKVGLIFNENSTISYRERRTIHYRPDLTEEDPDAVVVVPNIPFLSAVKMLSESNFVVKIGIAAAIRSTEAKLLTTQKAGELIWGYDDELVDFSKGFSKLKSEPLPFERFGILTNRNGTSRDVFNIHTGEDDISKLGMIMGFNGEDHIHVWETDECNEIDGSDGSQFPPQMVDRNQTINIYIKDMCRAFPLEYIEEVNLFEGVPAWRYSAARDVFANSSVQEKNGCFCEDDKCPPNGVFDASRCNFDAPIYVSFPHFYGGDESLYEQFEGIYPDPEKHMTYADIHPRLAFPISGASRFQVNVRIFKTNYIESDIKYFDDGAILPILWFELIPEEFSEDLRNLIYHSSFSANAVQVALKYGTIIVALITLTLFIATFICCDRHSDDDEKNGIYYGNGSETYYRPTTELHKLPVTPHNSKIEIKS